MNMPLELFMALRYLRAKRKQAFISVISLISILGVAIGVMALILVLGVMTGFTDDLRDKILGTNSHIVVSGFSGTLARYQDMVAGIDGISAVEAATPFIISQVMLSSGSAVSGVQLWGIDPETAPQVITIAETLIEGDLAGLTPPVDDGQPDSPRLPGIVVGSELATQLGLYPGAAVTVLSPAGLMSPAGMIPRWKKFQVAGIFESGMYEYDTGNAYVAVPALQEFLKMPDEVSGIAVKVRDIDNTAPVVQAIREGLPPGLQVRDWKDMHRNLYSALKLEKTAMFVILTLIVIVAAFSIVATLVMLVNEKTREIAILKSMGMTASSIMRIFIIQGLVIGLTGTLLGLAGGYGLALLQNRWQIIKLSGDVYYIAALTVKVSPWDTFWVAFCAVAISFLATLYPSRQAAGLDPVEAMRYE